ncbi:MAG: F0F1 ATP synthase subunit epsilon [Opitutaceae bacterium]|nr:F0F1 ATP synthase subunit epsilon [Opitutaceae bacterium]
MHLKILLPYKIFADRQNISRIVAVSHEGSFGLLPRRLDCVVPLSAGILVYETEAEDEVYIAIDEGVLVKAGSEVLVSVRNAIAGMGLDKLREAVEEEFLQMDEQEQKIRSVLAKMESGFVRRLVELHHE